MNHTEHIADDWIALDMHITPQARRHTIGIVFAPDTPGALPFWPAGGEQKLIFLALLLQRLDCVEEVVLVPASGSLPHPLAQEFGFACALLADAIAACDLLIEFGTRLALPADVDALHRRGGRIVSFTSGNTMLMHMQELVHSSPQGEANGGQRYDAAWVLPQFERMNRSYLSMVHSEQVHIFPNLWDPVFVTGAARHLRRNLFWRQPAERAFAVGCFDANISADHTFHLPLLAAEEAFRRDPSAIRKLLLFNTLHVKDLEHVNEMVMALDVGRAPGLVSLEADHPPIDMLGRVVDLVVSHQWEHDVSNQYFEVAYLGWPLVHNSHHFRDVGYGFADFNPADGGRQILRAVEDHAAIQRQQGEARQALFWAASIDNPATQQRCADLIADLFAR